MKNIVLAMIILLAICTPVFAQNQNSTEISDNEDLRAELKQETQSPEDKSIKFLLVLKSNIDSDRVQIKWSLRGVSRIFNEQQETLAITIQKGNSYSIPFTIQPLEAGVTELLATIEVVKVDKRFTVTAKKIFVTNESAEYNEITEDGNIKLPDDYIAAKNFVIIRNIAFITVAGVVFIFGSFFGFKLFVKWLNKEDRT